MRHSLQVPIADKLPGFLIAVSITAIGVLALFAITFMLGILGF